MLNNNVNIKDGERGAEIEKHGERKMRMQNVFFLGNTNTRIVM